MVEHHDGGILGALKILRDHWSAVHRDLITSGLHLSEWCTERLQFHELFAVINYAPPGTAIFHVLNEGWDANTHRLTDLLDVSALTMWLNTQDAQEKHPQYRPEPSRRPGIQTEMVAPEPFMTVGDYMTLLEGGD